MSALLLLPTAVRAAELQPFLTVKVSSINTLIGVAEKIATMADLANEPRFREMVNTVKDVRGINLNGDFGIAAAVAEDGSLNLILVLPITDLWKAEIPAAPEMFDFIRPFLARRSAERTDINSPMGTYAALQKQDYLVIVPEGIADQVPADARSLFADLEKYTIGIRLDLEKVKFETLEANIFGPMLFMAMMQDPNVGEQLENVIELYRELYKEFSMVSYGISFNPQTADTELAYSIALRDGSDMAKAMTGYKRQPTIFGGFRGTPANTVLSMGDAASWEGKVNFEDNAMLTQAMKQYEAIFDGIIEQIEMDDETGEAGKIAKDIIETLKKIYAAEANRGASDSAFSFNTDGVLLAAMDTVSLAEIQKLAGAAVGFILQKKPNIIGLAEIAQGYVSVEEFSVSRVKLPIVETMELFAGPAPRDMPAALRALNLCVFWAVKEGDKQAVAVAAGLDFDKTEQALKAALEQTKTTAPVQKPKGVLSVQGLGKFLQQTVLPIAEKADANNAEGLGTAKKVFAVLAGAEADAVVTIDGEVTAKRMDFGYRVSGKAIQAVVEAVKAAGSGF